MRIVVDGYNAIGRIASTRRYFPGDLQRAREELNDLLRRFKKVRGHGITVVYDGPGGIWGRQEAGESAGIREIFTSDRDQADDVIIRMARKSSEALVVVSADRRVTMECRKAGAAIMGPAELEEAVMKAILMDEKGNFPTEEDTRVSPGKKGPSKRMTKKKRREMKIKKKL